MPATTLAACPVYYRLLNNTDKAGHYRGSITLQGRTETLVFDVRWEDRGAFIGFVAGKSTAAGGTITRYQPLQNPFTTYLYATGIDFEAIGADPKVSPARPWPWIRFTITFGTIPWDPNGPTPYYTIRYRSSTSVATVPGAKLQFSNGEYIDHDYGILIGQFSIEITRFQIPSIADFLTTYAPLSGKVSSDDVVIQGFTYPAGHLMLPSVEAEEQRNSGGQPQTQATVSLVYRSIPWNSAIRSDAVPDSVLPAPYPITPFAPAFS